jgi:hypothetical protein
MILTIEFLAADLCRSVLEEDEEAIGKAAFLQAVLDKDWGSMEGFEAVFHEDEFIGVQAVRR